MSEQFVDIVKIVLRPETIAQGEALERKIEIAAARLVLKKFGLTDAPYRVDVLEFRAAPPHALLFQRIIQNGKFRRLS